ncbi:hypothetical protein LCGC14_3139410, partial [marine sediment metagenome]
CIMTALRERSIPVKKLRKAIEGNFLPGVAVLVVGAVLLWPFHTLGSDVASLQATRVQATRELGRITEGLQAVERDLADIRQLLQLILDHMLQASTEGERSNQ